MIRDVARCVYVSCRRHQALHTPTGDSAMTASLLFLRPAKIERDQFQNKCFHRDVLHVWPCIGVERESHHVGRWCGVQFSKCALIEIGLDFEDSTATVLDLYIESIVAHGLDILDIPIHAASHRSAISKERHRHVLRRVAWSAKSPPYTCHTVAAIGRTLHSSA